MAAQVEIPDNLVEMLQNPQRVRDALSLLNAISAMDLRLVNPSQYNRNEVLVGNPQGITLTLPLRFSAAIVDAADEAEAVDRLNDLLAELRALNINPS